jgi:hypothetical protein
MMHVTPFYLLCLTTKYRVFRVTVRTCLGSELMKASPGKLQTGLRWHGRSYNELPVYLAVL